jgi:ribonuclease P protein component
MLSRTSRISKTEFKALGRGVSYHSPNLFLSVYPKTDNFPSQFSFVCSKKVAKTAVKRNLLRRRGYNIIGKNLVDIGRGSYCVFSFKKGAENLSFKEIEGQILFLLQKSGKLS